ncbi:DUF58 domain-containing protein [uncultured Maribacter sp.]|uniref:DUF58 domain-containing protein n=1 Tax=uncultured Maribacter sp. TaxID=431308 RepID=UPI00262C222F|nr:DUF58 domain-containing protein [uncultured Maribacter sp.]
MSENKTSEFSRMPLIRFFKDLFLNNRFFYAMFGIIVLFVVSFIFPSILLLAKLLFFVFIALVLVDILILFGNKNGIEAQRELPEKFSNGDENKVPISITNKYSLKTYCTILEELPMQFQQRDFSIAISINANKKEQLSYTVRPTERGEYNFGKLYVYTASKIGLAVRRFSFGDSQMVKTYPSFLQLKKYDLISLNQSSLQFGIKKIRRIGNSFEFEQIKEYVQGDNIKDINWKATAKRNQLMVNQFQDEKSQQIYSIIDKGRVMKMPFKNLSLLDYAINAALVISSVVVRKHDKAGMFSFSKKPENFVVAERRNAQMNLIQESLYNVNTDFSESDFGNLYGHIKRKITTRSLLLLYTNFGSLDAVHRQMNYLRAINKSHMLVVVFFKNTELEQLKGQEAKNTQEIFDKTIAEKFSYDKKLIVAELNKFGIQTILTEPQNLTIDTINKYLEIKAKGLL